jgi:DNA-binding transcriptional MerR regulator
MMKKEVKSSYSIGEVAKMFNLNEWTIRFWANNFNILRPRRNQTGDIVFAPADVRTIKLISRLANKGGVVMDEKGWRFDFTSI